MKTLLLTTCIIIITAFSAPSMCVGQASALVVGKIMDRTCYNQSVQVIPCDEPGTPINRVIAVVEVVPFQFYFPVWCQRSIANLGACLTPPLGSVVAIEGYLLPQSLSPSPGGSGSCATAIGAVFLSPW